MSRRDYIAIAAALAHAVDIRDAKISIATHLSTHYPNFNLHLFLAAAEPVKA